MRPYELMVIIDTAVEDHSVEVKEIEGLVTRLGGEVSKTDLWGKRRLAYEIEKRTEGIYVLYTMKMKPEALSELDRLMKLRPMVVRHMTIALEEQE